METFYLEAEQNADYTFDSSDLAIEVNKVTRSRCPQFDLTKIPFGKIFSDHMFIANFSNGRWENPRVVPYAPITLSPASPALHYGQAIFEGIKAYKNERGEMLVFRPLDHWKRMNVSATRICMPDLPRELFMGAISTLLKLDKDWMPNMPGYSLYMRPFMFSDDQFIGIRPSENFLFMVIISPVSSYYSSAVKVRIETHYTRATKGGTGYIKMGGNYGSALFPTRQAQKEGYHQLIWTDGIRHEYIEESGVMNVMFVMDGTLITPPLSDSILRGITRDSVLTLARSWNIPVEERPISVKELVEGLQRGTVNEAFGTGTAATIAPIALINYEDYDYYLPPRNTMTVANRLLKELADIRHGKACDAFGWVYKP